MVYTPAGIVSYGYPLGDFTFTYALSGQPATDAAAAAVQGFPVALDTSAASTVKVAGDGDTIFGQIYVAENRAVLGIMVASVSRLFKEKFSAAVGHGIVVGDKVVGAATPGNVKKDPAAAGSAALLSNRHIVIETGTDYVVVEKL